MHQEFTVHKLNESGLENAHQVALIFDEALDKLEAFVPETRYLALVRTKLEEACFFAKKGVAQHAPNQA